MNYKLSIFILLFITSYWLLVTAIPAQANGLIPNCDRFQGDRPCQLEDFLLLFVNLVNLMLNILGSVALLAFVIGGVYWLLAAGNQSMIDKGKKILSGAVIGVIIVLGAWTLINFIMSFAPGYSGTWWKIKGIEEKSCWETWSQCPQITPGSSLKKDCKSEEVKTVQTKLNTLGCNCGKEDGCYGEETEACVKKFQEKNNLTIDGKVGTQTWNKLNEPNPNKCF